MRARKVPSLRAEDCFPEVTVLEVALRLASAERRLATRAETNRARPGYAPDDERRYWREGQDALQRAEAYETIITKLLAVQRILAVRRGGR